MLAKIARIVVPVAGVGVTVFGVLIPSWVEYRREVVNWSAAWAVFDVALGIIVIATWLVARRGHWAAIALAGDERCRASTSSSHCCSSTT